MVILGIGTAMLGTFFFSSSLQGFLFKKLNIFERIFMGSGGILLIAPSLIAAFIGIGTGGIAILLNFIGRKRLRKSSYSYV